MATAREVFAELGPEAPLDVIARRADVGSATLYRHFPTREDLLHATYRTDIVDLARRAVDLAEYFTPPQALERWLRDYFVPAQEEGGVASMLKDALVTALRSSPRAKSSSAMPSTRWYGRPRPRGTSAMTSRPTTSSAWPTVSLSAHKGLSIRGSACSRSCSMGCARQISTTRERPQSSPPAARETGATS